MVVHNDDEVLDEVSDLKGYEHLDDAVDAPTGGGHCDLHHMIL